MKDELGVRASKDGPGGADWDGDECQVKYRILNTVTKFEEGRRIAWRHFYGHEWRYLLEPATDSSGVPGTLVTEQWDARHVRGKFLLRLAGYLGRHPENIDKTLARLDSHVTGAQATS